MTANTEIIASSDKKSSYFSIYILFKKLYQDKIIKNHSIKESVTIFSFHMNSSLFNKFLQLIYDKVESF